MFRTSSGKFRFHYWVYRLANLFLGLPEFLSTIFSVELPLSRQFHRVHAGNKEINEFISRSIVVEFVKVLTRFVVRYCGRYMFFERTVRDHRNFRRRPRQPSERETEVNRELHGVPLSVSSVGQLTTGSAEGESGLCGLTNRHASLRPLDNDY